jgi:hypothetical protein
MAKHRFDEVDNRFKWGGPALLETWSHAPGTHGRDHEDVTVPEPSAEPRGTDVRTSPRWRRPVTRRRLTVVPQRT